ncbi:hypothetical protein F2P56_010106 [Juglans regia]|uniref:thioredoxin-dependent peroxiredoxin n=1 Tax=Juglans regia TaxID=51240 RepID=A0A834D0X3_JUGRE|nr:hypothetical protein F2P56_010106 [Juglans regia]
MACSAASTTLFSSNPRAFSINSASPISNPFSQSLTIPKSFIGLRKPLQSHAPRSVSLTRGSRSRRSFVVRASVSVSILLYVPGSCIFGSRGDGIALRGLFIIDKEGVIQHSTINNLAIGRSVDETKRTLQALQYVQENPDEVCPAGWKPGEKSMKPDPKLSKEYFSAI